MSLTETAPATTPSPQQKSYLSDYENVFNSEENDNSKE